VREEAIRMTWCSLPGVALTLLSSLSVTGVAEGLADGSQSEGANISAILNSFQIGYDRRVRPNYGGEPVTVGVTLFILSIGDLSEKFMDFTFDMYFRQFWKDPRLSFERKPNLEKLVVGAEYIKLIWVPDTFFCE
jgi:glycine receptor alpha-3